MMHRRYIAAFDIDDTLTNTENRERNHGPIQAIYEMLCRSDRWDVYIVTASGHSIEYIEDILLGYALIEPKEIIRTGTHKKAPWFKKIKADIVFDDRDECIEEAISMGALALKVC